MTPDTIMNSIFELQLPLGTTYGKFDHVFTIDDKKLSIRNMGQMDHEINVTQFILRFRLRVGELNGDNIIYLGQLFDDTNLMYMRIVTQSILDYRVNDIDGLYLAINEMAYGVNFADRIPSHIDFRYTAPAWNYISSGIIGFGG